MRGTKAKTLRKAIYGEMSHRTREYLKGHEPRMGGVHTSPSGRTYSIPNPTVICTGLRRAYQTAKRVGHPPINPVAQILSGASR